MIRRSGVVGAAVRRRTLFVSAVMLTDLESIWTACCNELHSIMILLS